MDGVVQMNHIVSEGKCIYCESTRSTCPALIEDGEHLRLGSICVLCHNQETGLCRSKLKNVAGNIEWSTLKHAASQRLAMARASTMVDVKRSSPPNDLQNVLSVLDRMRGNIDLIEKLLKMSLETLNVCERTLRAK
jgi:hypothetical protein